MNQLHPTTAAQGGAPFAGHSLPESFTLVVPPDWTPDIVFAAGTQNEMRVSADGLQFRGGVIEDAGSAYRALMAVLMGKAPEEIPQVPPAAEVRVTRRGMQFFRRRGKGGLWVEADQETIDIIAQMPEPDVYEVCTMYPGA